MLINKGAAKILAHLQLIEGFTSIVTFEKVQKVQVEQPSSSSVKDNSQSLEIMQSVWTYGHSLY